MTRISSDYRGGMGKRGRSSRALRGSAGFSLLELAIVVSVIGTLVTMSLPSVMNARKQSRLLSMVNDCRVIFDAMNMYAMDNGGFPKAPGPTPVPLTQILANARWDRPTALGGHWLYSNALKNSLLVIDDININRGTYPLAPTVDWQEVDRQIDDGDLTTGAFRLVSGMQIQFSLDESSGWQQRPTS